MKSHLFLLTCSFPAIKLVTKNRSSIPEAVLVERNLTGECGVLICSVKTLSYIVEDYIYLIKFRDNTSKSSVVEQGAIPGIAFNRNL